MSDEKTQNLAEKIALLLHERETDDFAFLRSSIEKINRRLDNIESQIPNPKSQIPNPVFHSSQEKFAIAEAVLPETIGQFETEKACPYEPTGKPCDHCAMCSSRGF